MDAFLEKLYNFFSNSKKLLLWYCVLELFNIPGMIRFSVFSWFCCGMLLGLILRQLADVIYEDNFKQRNKFLDELIQLRLAMLKEIQSAIDKFKKSDNI